MRKKIRGLVFAVIFLFCLFQGIPGTGIYWADEVSAGDYTDAGCVAWAKDRAREKLGIILPDTGNYPSGVYGASNCGMCCLTMDIKQVQSLQVILWLFGDIQREHIAIMVMWHMLKV